MEQTKRRYISESEQALLKATFKDREDLLLIIRNLFFGLPLDENEVLQVKKLATPDVKKLLRKVFLPELQKDIPIGQSVDLWMTLQLGGQDSLTQIAARRILIGAIKTALQLLEDPTGEKPSLDVEKAEIFNSEEGLMARNSFIGHIEFQLNLILTLVNEPDETPEARAKRLKKDSMK